MQLTDHTNGAVLQQVVDGLEQQGHAVAAVAHHVIAGSAEQAANLAGRVVMIDVKATLAPVLPGIGEVADIASTRLSDDHAVVFGNVNPVVMSKGARLLGSNVRHMPSADVFHVGNRLSRVLGLPRVSALGVFVAEGQVLAHLPSVERQSTELARLEYPSTWLNEWLIDARVRVKQLARLLPFSMFNLDAGQASVHISGLSKLHPLFDRLTHCTNALAVKQGWNFRAVLAPVSRQAHSLNESITKGARNGLGFLHNPTFGSLASMIKRRIAPESVIDQAAASWSALSRMRFSTRKIIFSVFGSRFICTNKCNTAKAVCQHQIQQKERGLVFNLAAH